MNKISEVGWKKWTTKFVKLTGGVRMKKERIPNGSHTKEFREDGIILKLNRRI